MTERKEKEFVAGPRLNPHSFFAKGGFIYRRFEASGIFLLGMILALFDPEAAYFAVYKHLALVFCMKLPKMGEGEDDKDKTTD